MRAVRVVMFTIGLMAGSSDIIGAQPAQAPLIFQRVDVHMDYDWKMPKGRAAVQWTKLLDMPGLADEQARIALAGFLYARTIVNHAETRRALIERTEPAAIALVEGAEQFAVDAWRLEAGGLSFPIYPWQRVTPDRVEGARTYTAYLIEMPDGRIGGQLDMAWGLERILAPAAPLIMFEALAMELPKPEKVLLGRVILSVNEFYDRVNLNDTARLIGTDTLVMTIVVSMLRDEQLFNTQRGATGDITRAELHALSESLAKSMGRVFALQTACDLRSSVAPDRAAGFFINYLSEAEVQDLISESYAAGMEETAGRPCDRVVVGQGLLTTMTEMGAYTNSARPFMKEW